MNFFSLFKRNLTYKFKKKILIDKDNVSLNTLDELFQYYGSDKSNQFKKANRQGHGYSKFYTTYLQNYKDKNDNLNTFISVFPTQEPKYTLLVMLQNPQVAKNLIYNYRGLKVKGTRNEAGWNSVYVAGKIIEKIGPILAINNEEFTNHVAEKIN